MLAVDDGVGVAAEVERVVEEGNEGGGVEGVEGGESGPEGECGGGEGGEYGGVDVAGDVEEFGDGATRPEKWREPMKLVDVALDGWMVAELVHRLECGAPAA